MTPEQLLSSTAEHRIRLWVENGRLRYHAPRGSLTPELRALLEGHRDVLIAHLSGRTSTTPISYPLSYSQQFLWFLYQLAPQSAAYNVAFVARVVSPVDMSRLKMAFQTIVDRHPVLRSTYDSTDGVPFMRIHDRVRLVCERIDASPWTEEELCRAVHEKYAEPFDLVRGPVVRVQLFTCGIEEHVLLITLHHITCDGWSVGILLKEFRELYSRGREVHLPAPAAQYSDYVQYQSAMLASPEGERLRQFWLKQLTGELSELNLPADRQADRNRISPGGTLHFNLTGNVYSDIADLARRSGVTPYVLFLAAFQTLLMRYSSQEDVLVGTPMASRPRKEDEFTVGCYINPVVLRGILPAGCSFTALLTKTRKTVAEALAHRHYPFPLLVEQLRPSRDLGRAPIIRAMFNLLNRQTLGQVADLLYRDIAEAARGANVEFGALHMRPFPMNQEEGQFDLDLQIIDDGHTYTGLLKYNTDLFEPATIARMAEHLKVLLKGVVANPDCPLGDLPLLSAAERHTVLSEWNQTQADYPQNVCLHTLFANQVQKTPEAIAVVFEDESLTYRELDVCANRLARRLRSFGAGPEVLIGVHLERSLEMVIALYAILKAGAAYVPLDPDYPKERLAFMIEEMKAPVILTQRRLKAELPVTTAMALCLDDPDFVQTLSKEESAVPADSSVQPDNLAYVIYTSGSTGRPKGAMNTQRGIVNRLLWMQETYRLSASDVVLQKTPFSFDVSVWEFFWPLLAGAKLVLARPGGHRDAAYLAKTIVQHGVTTMHFVPSMLGIFLEDKAAATCQCLKRVICSGEALPYELQERFFRVLNAELHNLYGPTEAAVDVTAWACRRGDQRQTVPIGKPVANTQIYILDSHLQPVPIGVAGELYIGGVQVARGYVNRPDLTAERFIPDPFQPQPGARLYRTGDLCRYRRDGNIEYLGRNDFQVKIRGMRIELGEIESTMRQFPNVRDALVLMREDTPGDKRLTGYIVSAATGAIDLERLRSFLKERLAEYMVPASFVLMEEFPLTSSGKVDRRALPAPQATRQTATNYVPPFGETERRVAQIWEEILGIDRVGLEDRFFDIGGHSLLLVGLAAKLQESFGRPVSVMDLFQRPTVAEQARFLANEICAGTNLPDAQDRARKQKAFLSQRAKKSQPTNCG